MHHQLADGGVMYDEERNTMPSVSLLSDSSLKA